MEGATGISWRWRAYPLGQSYWYQAYSSVSSDGLFDKADGIQIYELLMQLFSAIQMAGANLNPNSVHTGLTSYERFDSDTNHSPTAYYTAGDYTYVKDFELLRWDITQAPPGGADAPPGGSNGGCWIEIGGGQRHAADQWPPGDHGSDPGGCGAEWGSSATDWNSDNTTG
jgi:hypothetical protein